MRRWIGGAVVALVLGGFTLLAAEPGYAADGGLDVTVDVATPLAPTLRLTNHGARPCQVARTALGTVSILAFDQGGQAAVPQPFTPGLDEPLDAVLRRTLTTLAPGASVTVPLQIAPVGDTGHAVEIVTATSGFALTGLFYPVREGTSLHLEAAYAMPAVDVTGAPLCVPGIGGGTSAAGAGAAATSRAWLVWAVAALGVLLIVIVIVALLIRRRGRRGTAAAALILLAATVATGWRPGTAHATVQISDPSLRAAYDACLATLQQPGHDPAHILPTLLGAGDTVLLSVPNDGVTHEGGGRSLQVIFWNVNDRHAYFGSGGNADPCASLYHEMFHAWEDSQGRQDNHECITAGEHHTGIGINEVRATQAQNQLRHELGLPERSHYGNRPLPTTPCRPSRPTDPRCQGETGCAAATGDPHLTTFDGRHYDFQGAGEFVATEDPAGGYAIQVRQRPFADSTTVAVTTAVAMDVAGTRVQVQAAGSGLAALVDGQPPTAEITNLDQGGQLRLGEGDTGALATVTWPDGSAAWVSAFGVGLTLNVQPAPGRGAKLRGLLGTADGDPANDVRPRGGAPIAGDGILPLYPAYADSWRITAATSLFTYADGTSTATFTDRSFPSPNEPPAPDPAAARAICAHAGVTAEAALAACIFDVSRTGVPAFATAAAANQAFLAGARPGDTVAVPATADIYLAVASTGALPPSAGTLPVRYAFHPGTDHAVAFPLVEGITGPAGGEPADGPDGGNISFSDTDITGMNGISGIKHGNECLFLVGLFLPDGATDAAAQQPDVTGHDTLTQVPTTLGVLFAIGDGRTTDGTLQNFTIPTGATRLYLGYADASGFHGPPGFYDDNTGGLSVSMTVS